MRNTETIATKLGWMVHHDKSERFVKNDRIAVFKVEVSMLLQNFAEMLFLSLMLLQPG